MIILLKWLISAIIILISAYIVSGIEISSLWIALVLVVVWGLLNISLKPILIFLTLPINILTLGLFIFVINALIILFTATFIKGLYVDGFVSALLFTLILTLIQSLFEMIMKSLKNKKSR